MPRKIPVDFEEKIKLPAPASGKGYPYQISAKDLMSNFKYVIALIPEGAAGDMLYHDGTDWVLLAAPSATAEDPVSLTHDGTTPSWGGAAAGDTVSIVVVDNGEFKTGDFLIDGTLTAIP